MAESETISQDRLRVTAGLFSAQELSDYAMIAHDSQHLS
jgi:hypothetical protein